MKEPSPPDHQEEGKVDIMISKRHNSLINKGMTRPIKNKWKKR